MAMIVGIAVRGKPGAPMQLVSSVEVFVEHGLEGNPGGGGKSRKRQVTLLSVEQWVKTRDELGGAWLFWTLRRANLYIEGLCFGPKHVGKVLAIGDAVELEILGETTPCERMDEVYPGLKGALAKDWRGGVYAKVRKGGRVHSGADVRFLEI